MPLRADDGAASIAAGGIIVMKRETRIVMAKEVLSISATRVAVDYEFRNDSDADITTEVAFPIPAYQFDGMACCSYAQQQGFDDFQLWVNERPAEFTTETRAFMGKREITALLARLAVDAGSFGHYQDSVHMERRMDGKSRDIERLTAAQRQRLIAVKALDDGSPAWKVEKKYHWTQTFPAHGIVHIRHAYTPVLGNSNTIGDPAVYHGKDAVWEYAHSCPGLDLRNTLSKVWNRPRGLYDGSPLWISYVSFILTTANTWKTPIEDFTLIVERPHKPKYKTYVSFCWDGPVTQVDADHFSAHLTGFVPTKELMVGYIFAEAK